MALGDKHIYLKRLYIKTLQEIVSRIGWRLTSPRGEMIGVRLSMINGFQNI